MVQQIEEILFQAIKSDDRKSFDALMEKTQCGAYRLGRFPTLSLLYLYNSRKILAAYEDIFLKTTNSVTLSEPAEISKKFTARAGKCLRLYMKEVVSPLEMLLILDKTNHLKKVYPSVNLSSAVKERLKSIYYIRYSLSVKFEGGNIVFEKRPMTRAEKNKLLTICVSCVLIVLIAISGCVISSVFMPKRLDTYLDLTADTEYTLDRDVYVPRGVTIEEFNCTIIGNGHKLTFRSGSSIEKFNGKVSDLVIETSGKPIITLVSSEAKIEDVTLNVKADVTATQSTSFFVLTNNGTIDNVKVNVSGKLRAATGQTSSDQANSDFYVGGIALSNVCTSYNPYTETFYNGVISNCSVNYSNFSLVGELSADASFGGVVGYNDGCAQDNVVTGNINADTLDVAGICSTNVFLLSGNVNKAEISQTCSNESWSPISSGIALWNYYSVKNCQNVGAITSTSAVKATVEETSPSATASGIVYMNGGGSSIENCLNSAEITANGNGEAYVGGICSISYGGISYSLNTGVVGAKANDVYAGGILGVSQAATSSNRIYYTTIESCVSQGKISAQSSGDSFVGGIVGYIYEIKVRQYKTDENGYVIKGEDGEYVIEEVYYGGRVLNSYFTGELPSSATYLGNIAGVCGANIYETNSFTSGSNEYYNFDGNYYISNSYGAFGATVSDGEYNDSVEDKGATASTLEQIEELDAYWKIVSKFIYDSPANS